MKERFPKNFTRPDLAEYSFSQRVQIKVLDLIFYFLINAICRTMRFETANEQNWHSVTKGGSPPIYCFWHDRLFAGTYFFRNRNIMVLSSKSFDGEYIVRFLNRFGYGNVRGSSTRGGVKGLVELIRLMRAGLPSGFTVDGPRGPRYEVKGGVVILAKKTGSPMLPFIVESKKYWTIKSWDKLQIPKPFTRACVMFGDPIYVTNDADDAEILRKTNGLQASLDDLVKQGAAWRDG